jgi:CheY-like chemotaxis protein
VSVESRGAGQGTVFRVSLPATTSSQPSAAAASSAAARDARGVRVVVADDNADAADSLAALLRAVGHEVRVAHDGQEALDVARSFRPAVALLDIGMPGLNGYEVAKRIRSEPWGGGVLLIAVTGWGQQEDRRRAFEAGFDGHLTKPAQLDDIEVLITKVREKG